MPRPTLKFLPGWALKLYIQVHTKTLGLVRVLQDTGDPWKALQFLGYSNFRPIKHRPKTDEPTTTRGIDGPEEAFIVNRIKRPTPTPMARVPDPGTTEQDALDYDLAGVNAATPLPETEVNLEDMWPPPWPNPPN